MPNFNTFEYDQDLADPTRVAPDIDPNRTYDEQWFHTAEWNPWTSRTQIAARHNIAPASPRIIAGVEGVAARPAPGNGGIASTQPNTCEATPPAEHSEEHQ